MLGQDPVLGDLYNAATDLIGRNLTAGRGSKVAYVHAAGETTYAELDVLTNRFANVLVGHGLQRDERIALALHDTVEWPVCFLGAIKAGVVPIPLNTRLTAKDYEYMLADSRARGLVVAESLLPAFAPHIANHPELRYVIVVGDKTGGHVRLADLMGEASDTFETAPTRADDMCFWLYTSGTTGRPKGAVHLHSHLTATADLYAIPTLGIGEDDVCFSAAKLFFAYGLGNALSFPMAVGATTILHAGAPDPASVIGILRDKRPSLFFGVPTLFAMLLAQDDLAAAGEHAMRLCASAGEALPADIWRRWHERTGVEILDGLGSTEMLHIFLSNTRGHVIPGASGTPVPGYELRLIDDDGSVIEGPDKMGMLEVSGPTSAIMYWSQREKSRETFRGEWTRTGDKYMRSAEGVYTYCGRNDDMMKVGGIYVSPFEVEGALLRHEAVLEVAVVGHPDSDGLTKPRAYVVMKNQTAGSDGLAEELIGFVREQLADYKRPRWVDFVPELPKTATGKIQRYKLRTGA